MAWEGGRIVDLYKGKSDRLECDSSRGLLIGDHAGKAVIGAIKDVIDPFTASSCLIHSSVMLLVEAPITLTT